MRNGAFRSWIHILVSDGLLPHWNDWSNIWRKPHDPALNQQTLKTRMRRHPVQPTEISD
jgi:hypothetical protein